MEFHVQAVELLADPPDLVDMTREAEANAIMLYHVLVQMLKGKSKKRAMACEVGNGFKLWWELRHAYESMIPGRHQSMLMALLKPDWSSVPARDFESAILDWELAVQRYEQQSTKNFDDDNKLATVLMWAPETLRLAINAGDPQNRASYPRLCAALLNLINGNITFSPGGLASGNPDAMQVDAVKGKFKGTKSKGKGKDTKGKSKGKGDGKFNTKTQDKAKGKQKTFEHKFQGYCRACGKWGHKQLDCWATAGKGDKMQVDAAAVAATTQVDAVRSAPSNSCRYCEQDVGVSFEVYNNDKFHHECRALVEDDPQPASSSSSSSWVMAVQVFVNAVNNLELNKDECWVLWDSGSDEHLCRSSLAKHGRAIPTTGMPMPDVQGNLIPDAGTTSVELELSDYDEAMHTAKVEFRIGEVNHHVMSAGKVISRNMFRAVLDSDGSYLQRKDDESICIPLYLRRNSYYLKVRVGGVPQLANYMRRGLQVAPLAVEELMGVDEDLQAHDEVAPPLLEEPLPSPPQPPVVAQFPLLGPGRADYPPGISEGSSVEVMRAWLKQHQSAVYGTKQQLFSRILLRNHVLLKEEVIANELAKQLEERREGQPLMPVMALPTPRQPSKAERDEHELTHAKFAPWCEFCIMGKGPAAAHRAVTVEDREPSGPRFEFDFAHMKADGSFFDDGEEYEHSLIFCTHLVGVDCGNEKIFATSMDLKDGADSNQGRYNVESVVQWLRDGCYRRITIRTDGEPALVALMERVKTARPEDTVLQRTPTRSSQSLGAGERAVRTVKEQFKTLRFQLEVKAGMKLHPGLPIWAWIGRHAAWLYTRYHVRASGRTAYEEATDSSYKSEIAVFGETMYFEEATSKTGQQQQHRHVKGADSAWLKGVWVGRAEATTEHILLTDIGLRRTVTVRRLPEESRFQKQVVLLALGVPWDPMSGVQRGRPKSQTSAPVAIPVLAQPAVSPPTQAAEPEVAYSSVGQDVQVGPEAVLLAAENLGDDLMSIGSPPRTPATLDPFTPVRPQPVSHARQAFLEREREAWRNHVTEDEETKRARVAGVYAHGPTVDDIVDVEDYYDLLDEDETEDFSSWTADDEAKAKTKHLRDVIDFNDSYEVVDDKFDTTGYLKLTCTWVTAIRDEQLKCRLCARDFAKTKRDDLVAPGSTSLTNRVIDFKAVKHELESFTVDVLSAYNTLDEPEKVIVTPPKEWYDERAVMGLPLNVKWRMKKLLPGRRVAAWLWVDYVGEVHKSMGFVQCPGFRQFFHHVEKNIICDIHMDDPLGCGPSGNIDGYLEEFGNILNLKRALHHRQGAVYEHLKRIRHVCAEGRLIQVNPKYVKEVVSRMGLGESKPVPTPLSDILRPLPEDDDEPLEGELASEYRSLTCTLLYASHDIADVKFALRILTMDLKNPMVKSWERLKRVRRT